MRTQLTPVPAEGPGRTASMVSLAQRQHGVASHSQLLGLGFSTAAIGRRRRDGLLIPIHRGVYAVGHAALRSRGWWWAALLAVADGAVLSHFTAATLWSLLPARDRIHLSVPGRTGAVRHAGVTVHRPRSLPATEIEEVDALPVTSLARTLVDLAAVCSELQLARALEEAEKIHTVDLRAIQQVLSHSRGRRGTGALRRVIREARPGVTRSDLELAFRGLCGAAGTAMPLSNVPIDLGDGEVHEADFYWPDRRLVIETDGFDSHSTRRSFVADRRLDRRIRAAGFGLERFPWDDVFLVPEETTREIASIVARHPPLAAGGVS